DWRYEKIDISSMDGESEVMVKFTSTSDYGNSLYLDDIQVNKSAVVSLDEETVAPEIRTYPNPAVNHFTVQMANASDFSVELVNSLGQVVKFLEYTNTVKGNVNVSDLSAGVYILNINVDGHVSTQRISVVK